MRKLLLLVAFLFPIVTIYAQGNDYVAKKDFQSETRKLSEGIQSAKHSYTDLKKIVSEQQIIIDSLTGVAAGLQSKATSAVDSATILTAKISAIQADLRETQDKSVNGMIILGVLMLFFIAAAFFYVRMIGSNATKRLEELTETLAEFIETHDKDLAEIRTSIKDNGDHILFLSDELKSQVARITRISENDSERAAMIEEKVKNLSFENEINLKVNRDKVLALQKDLEQVVTDFDDKVKQVNAHFTSEIVRIAKTLKSDKEKGELV